MHRYDIDEVEAGEYQKFFDSDNRQFSKRNADQPKRSPIRRKDKWRQEDGVKPNTKRNHKKNQHKIKYDWQGE